MTTNTAEQEQEQEVTIVETSIGKVEVGPGWAGRGHVGGFDSLEFSASLADILVAIMPGIDASQLQARFDGYKFQVCLEVRDHNPQSDTVGTIREGYFVNLYFENPKGDIVQVSDFREEICTWTDIAIGRALQQGEEEQKWLLRGASPETIRTTSLNSTLRAMSERRVGTITSYIEQVYAGNEKPDPESVPSAGIPGWEYPPFKEQGEQHPS